MNKTINVSTEILDFLTGIHGSENRKGDMFDKAFELAYKDMATHTVAYKKEAKEKYFYKDNTICNKNRKAVKECIKAFVKEKIFGGIELQKLKENLVGQDCFDSWHKRACETFSEFKSEFKKDKEMQLNDGKAVESLDDLIEHENKNIFTIGQAQKLINMMIKYLYIYNKCEEEKGRVLKSEDLSNIENHAHTAIDNYVLEKVFKKNYKNKKWSGLQEYAKEGDEDTYCKYKKEIEKSANKEHETMFLWELKNWPFNKH